VEGVALTGLHLINLAWNFYHTVTGSHSDMSRSNLLVLPEIQQKYQVIRNGVAENRSYVIASNLAYVASFKRAPTFVIYPTAPADAPKGNESKPNLWESPWGIAHEFGHHVLRTHSGKSGFDTNSLEDADALDEQRFDHVPDGDARIPGVDLTASVRAVGAKDHWQAVNEGFADLFAFYSLDQQPQLAKNIPCMDISRDVLSAKFASGRAKSLDSVALGLYASPEAFPSDNCTEPNFQAPHSVGAVVAYGVNRLFQGSVLVSRGGSKNAAKLLLDWADRLRDIANLGPEAITLSELVRLAVEVAAEPGNHLTATQCGVVRDVFPMWQEQWLGAGNGVQAFQCN
jgi:hypothetical protein